MSDKPETISGYLVDPYDATISRVELQTDNTGSILEALRSVIGCRLVEAVKIGNGHELWCDEEGWLAPTRAAIAGKAANLPKIAGRAVILRSGPDGQAIPPSLSMDEFAKRLKALQPHISAEFEGSGTTFGDTFVYTQGAEYVCHIVPQTFTVIC